MSLLLWYHDKCHWWVYHGLTKWRQFVRWSNLPSILEEKSFVKPEIWQDTGWYKQNVSAVFCPLNKYRIAIKVDGNKLLSESHGKCQVCTRWRSDPRTEIGLVSQRGNNYFHVWERKQYIQEILLMKSKIVEEQKCEWAV